MRYFFILLLCFACKIFAAGGQLLNSTFFPNPSAISKINTFEFIAGNLFFVPTLTFNGTSYGKTGTASSDVYDPVPYMYLNYRINNKLVVGVNMIPSIYGDILWPADSVVARASTMTSVLYYRSGVLASYQITPDLALGVGVNIERVASQIAFMNELLGYETNKTAGYNYISDFGLSYKLTTKDLISLAYYTPIYTFVRGVSRAGNLANYNYSTLKVDAAVTFFNLNHKVNDYWSLDGGVYFSKWSRLKQFMFFNTVSGDIVLPAYWRNVWSFLLTSKHNITDKSIFIWQILYETNPARNSMYNYIGFPLSSAINLSTGFEYNFYKNFYVTVIGSYGTFAPRARINNADSYGSISANIYTGMLEGTWRF